MDNSHDEKTLTPKKAGEVAEMLMLKSARKEAKQAEAAEVGKQVQDGQSGGKKKPTLISTEERSVG